MTVLRRIARPLLASIFVSGGIDALRNPPSETPGAEEVAAQMASAVPALSGYDTETLIKINGGVQVAAGSLLALGRFPRLSALALAASIVPTMAADRRSWEAEGVLTPQQRTEFLKSASILGGLLLAAADTEGKPGLGWRAHHTAEHAEAAIERSRRKARRAAKTARREAKLVTKTARAALPVV